jgi:hypothetical protein
MFTTSPQQKSNWNAKCLGLALAVPLFSSVLGPYAAAGKLRTHGFAAIRDHVYVFCNVPGEMSLEKAVQLIRGILDLLLSGRRSVSSSS